MRLLFFFFFGIKGFYKFYINGYRNTDNLTRLVLLYTTYIRTYINKMYIFRYSILCSRLSRRDECVEPDSANMI